MINFDENETKCIKLFHDQKKKYEKRQELEIIFSPLYSSSPIITRVNFINLLKHMKNSAHSLEAFIDDFDGSDKEWRQLEPTTTLDITLHRGNNINKKEQVPNIRISIKGSENISNYCMNNDINQIEDKFIEIMYKKPATMPDGTPEEVSKGSLFIENYGIKFNLKDEIIFNKHGQPQNDYSNDDDEELFDKANRAFGSIVFSKYSDYYKTFRLKNRYSFISKENIRLDLTVVQKSYEARNDIDRIVPIPVKEFIDSKLLESEKTYEIELELFVNETAIPESIDIDKIKEKINFVITNINKYPYVISKEEERDISYIFKQLIKKNLHDIAAKKLFILNKIQEIGRLEFQQKNKKSVKDNEKIKMLETECINKDRVYFERKRNESNISDQIKKLNKEYIIDKKYRKDNFYKIGPKPITLNTLHIQNNNERLNSIVNNNYTVTDKADGLGKYLYIVGTSHLNLTDKNLYDKYKGKIYLIDNNLKIYSTNLLTSDEYSNSLLNGEFINKDLSNKDTFRYIAYDIYFTTKDNTPDGIIDTKKLPFMSSQSDVETRLNILKDLVKNINENFSDVSLKDIISVKNFLLYNKENSLNEQIFKHSHQVWYHHRPAAEYKYDGLIYTPADLPVGFDDKDIDYDLKTGKTWDLNLKWKPQHENTIDFLLKEDIIIDKYNNYEINESTSKTRLIKKGGETKKYKYKTFNLLVGKKIDRNIEHLQSKAQPEIAPYMPTKFIPNRPYSNEAYIAKLIVDEKKNIVYGNAWDDSLEFDDTFIDGIVRENRGDWKNTDDIITDDTIVEFSYQNYDKSDQRYIDDEHFRWIPLRTRHDKTYEYKKGVKEQKWIYSLLQKFRDLEPRNFKGITTINDFKKLMKTIMNVPDTNLDWGNKEFENFEIFKKNIDKIEKFYPDYTYITVPSISYGNDYYTASNNWYAIHNPITEDMITTGQNIPIYDEFEEDEKYYRRDLSKIRDKSLTIDLQNFHNLIKNDLYKNVCDIIRYKEKDRKISLLDLGTGKGGDMHKWYRNSINTIVGIDLYSNNINDPRDGALVRRDNLLSKNKEKFPDIQFICGNISKNIMNGDAFGDEISIDLWKKIWKTKNYENDKFDIISIMFAIHYFFQNENILDNLIENINQNLKEGGYFIGTCLDGETIFKYLSKIKFEEHKEGRKGTTDDNLIWRIYKKYYSDNFDDDKNSLGLEIDFYISSINQQIIEYLVNFDYLVKKLKNRGIRLLKPQETSIINLPQNASHGLFDLYYDRYYNEYNKRMSQAEEEISFKNKYFIFIKETNDEMLANNILEDIIYKKFYSGEGIGNKIRSCLLRYNYSTSPETMRKIISEFKREQISDQVWKIIHAELLNQYNKGKFKAGPSKTGVKATDHAFALKKAIENATKKAADTAKIAEDAERKVRRAKGNIDKADLRVDTLQKKLHRINGKLFGTKKMAEEAVNISAKAAMTASKKERAASKAVDDENKTAEATSARKAANDAAAVAVKLKEEADSLDIEINATDKAFVDAKKTLEERRKELETLKEAADAATKAADTAQKALTDLTAKKDASL